MADPKTIKPHSLRPSADTCWTGTSAMAATCPGAARRTRTPSGWPKRCYSRPRSARSSPTMSVSWLAFPLSKHWRQLPSTTCSRHGKGWAITPAPAICTAPPASWSRTWGSHLPQSPEQLRRLPGVGRYTAAAVASIAFGQDAAALDANLRRVVCRLYGIDQDPGRPATQRRLEELALAMMPPGRAGDANQAFMDLGATICTAANPRCSICPLAELCQAQQAGRQDALPVRAARPSRPHHDVTAAVIRDGNDRFLIAQRPLESMLGGLWEFPGGKRLPGEELRDCLRREIEEELGVEIEVGELLCAIDHTFTHFHMTLYAFDCRIVHDDAPLPGLPRSAVGVARRCRRLCLPGGRPEDPCLSARPASDNRLLRRPHYTCFEASGQVAGPS